jgi:aarF domain-containing kinase
VSKEIQRVRKQMEQDEQLATLMRGLRGQNLRDEQFAADNVRLRLVELESADNNEGLPLVYSPCAAAVCCRWFHLPSHIRPY